MSSGFNRRKFMQSGAAALAVTAVPANAALQALYKDKTRSPEVRAKDLLRRMTLAEKIAQMENDAPVNERLGIPKMMHGEALHGVVTTKAFLKSKGLPEEVGPTIFPQAIALGSTWDPQLIEEVANAIAAEARSLGITHAYAPVIGVARDARFGRSEETYGEDPYLVSRMGVAYVNGLQGTGAARFDSQHVMATGKHYAGYQLSTGGVNGNYVDLSRRMMYDIFLPPFEAAVKEAGIGAVMPAHSDIDGIPAHMNKWLLTEILRDDWGFKGFVVSDNIDIYRLYEMHHVARSPAQAAILALKAGVDMELDLTKGQGYATYKETLVGSIKAGKISESYVDNAVLRILEAKFKLGLFDHATEENPGKVLGSPAHRQLALRAAEKALVLLKNDGVLPLAEGSAAKIAIIGPHGDYVEFGDYAGTGHAPGVPLNAALPKLLPQASIRFARGAEVTGEDKSGFAAAVQLARDSDLVIMAIGGSHATCGEGHDRDEIGLPGVQQELFDEIAATGKPIVTVLTNGRPLTISDVVQRSKALLEGWYLGCEAGVAMSEVLVGKVNPGGKLTMTFPKSLGQLPSFYQKKAAFTGMGHGEYIEGKSSPLFPFGFGLSYTTFRLANIRLASSHIRPNGSTTLMVDVTNTGSRAGDEVVQFYVSQDYASIGRWEKLLKGFQRVTLQPNETRTISFPVGFKELSLWNANFKRVVEPGGFSLRVGTSSDQLETVHLTVDGDGSDLFG